MSVVNHTLTLCAPVVYVLGAVRFFGRFVGVDRVSAIMGPSPEASPNTVRKES